jgi:hypothetical protein
MSSWMRGVKSGVMLMLRLRLGLNITRGALEVEARAWRAAN